MKTARFADTEWIMEGKVTQCPACNIWVPMRFKDCEDDNHVYAASLMWCVACGAKWWEDRVA